MKMWKDFLISVRVIFSVLTNSSPPTSGPPTPSPQKAPPLAEWFRVQFDDSSINLQVDPPNRDAWEAQIKWERIIRVCFNAGDLYNLDEIYIFTGERPESYLIPTEANGGIDLWNEIIRRKLFDAEVAIEVASSTNKIG